MPQAVKHTYMVFWFPLKGIILDVEQYIMKFKIKVKTNLYVAFKLFRFTKALNPARPEKTMIRAGKTMINSPLPNLGPMQITYKKQTEQA